MAGIAVGKRESDRPVASDGDAVWIGRIGKSDDEARCNDMGLGIRESGAEGRSTEMGLGIQESDADGCCTVMSLPIGISDA